ncbi:MAG: site-specific integrase [Clostridia bacterium]|nr:site-specific integrase [Clostridia bacterium]
MPKQKKRENGLYQKQINVGKRTDGSYIRKTVYAKTQKELEEKIAEATDGIRLGIGYNAGNTSFGVLANLWLESQGAGMTEKWIYRQTGLIERHLLPSLGSMKIKDLKAIHFQILIGEKAREGLSTSTMKQIKQTAVRILNLAVDSEMITRNVFERVTIPRKEAKEREALDDDQIKMVNETWSSHFMGYPALIMLYCGLRKGEMLALHWKDIDLKRDIITVNKSVTVIKNQPAIKKPKSRAGIREVPIPRFLHDVLMEVKGAPKDVVCPDSSGGYMSDSAYSSAWHSYMNHLNLYYGGRNASRSRNKELVIKPFTAHMLRHTYATLLYDAGVDVKSAQKFLGHASVEMTLSVYTHLTKFKVDGAIENLNGHIAAMGYWSEDTPEK